MNNNKKSNNTYYDGITLMINIFSNYLIKSRLSDNLDKIKRKYKF